MTMPRSSPHTLSAFDADLREVSGLIAEMSSLVIAAVENALAALARPDEEVAAQVAADDRIIDALQERLDKTVVRTIALRAPMADDLRALVVAIRIGALLERAGDQAKGICRQREAAWSRAAAAPLRMLARMGEQAVGMLRDSITAYAAQDCALAGSVRMRDAELNRLFDALNENLLARMGAEPGFAASGTQLLMAGKEIERIGDYAANISDAVHYLVTGEHFADWRTTLPAAA